jgi:Uma2 family endonuclease
MPVSEDTFRRVSMEDPDGHWELHDGCLRQKPPMTFEHNHVQVALMRALLAQLSLAEFVVRMDNSLVRRSETRYYIPDIFVTTRDVARRSFPEPRTWEVYSEPLLLVVEVWSPSTGRSDLDEKLVHYQQRGDAEIWLLHPYEQTLRAWRRLPDGRYSETIFRGGMVEPAALPGVRIDLDEIFSVLR